MNARSVAEARRTSFYLARSQPGRAPSRRAWAWKSASISAASASRASARRRSIEGDRRPVGFFFGSRGASSASCRKSSASRLNRRTFWSTERQRARQSASRATSARGLRSPVFSERPGAAVRHLGSRPGDLASEGSPLSGRASLCLRQAAIRSRSVFVKTRGSPGGPSGREQSGGEVASARATRGKYRNVIGFSRGPGETEVETTRKPRGLCLGRVPKANDFAQWRR